MSVALLILHIEWMTQRHYLESVRDEGIDRQFNSLLRHHWMEEAQHAKLDTLMVAELAKDMPAAEVGRGVGLPRDRQDDRRRAGAAGAFDLAALMNASGRRLDETENAGFTAIQHQAQRWTFIGSGMTHPNFLGTMASSRRPRQAGRRIAPAFC